MELAFRAELLSRDKQRVLLTVCTPVRPLPVFNPLKLTYAGPPKSSVKLDPKTGAQLSATPLAWSHATYVYTVLKYLDKVQQLQLVRK